MHRLIVIIVLLLSCSGISNGQDAIIPGPVDVSDYPDIELQFRVLQDGIVVENPDSSRLLISENGILLPSGIVCPGAVQGSVSIALGVERSLDSYFPEAKARASSFIERVRFGDSGDELSLWSFASLPEHRLAVTRDSARLQQEVSGLGVAQWPFNGTTLYETMHRAVEDIEQSGSGNSKSLVFVTDGVNNTANYNRTLDQVMTRANAADIRIYVLGVRSVAGGQAAMKLLCEGTGGFYVHGSDPAAIDSVYEAIARRSIVEQFCHARFTSPRCADGTNRTIDLRYVNDSGDTLAAVTSYMAPYREEDLDSLPFWVSPRQLTFNGPDTVSIAAGLTLPANSTMRSFAVIMFHPGMLYADELVNMAPAGWRISARAVAEHTILTVVPPPGNALAAGEQLLVRLRMTVPQQADVVVTPTLDRPNSECYVFVPADVRRAVGVRVDTLLSERLIPLELPFRIAEHAMPEGVQQIVLEIRTPRHHAAFERDEPLRLTREGWIVDHAVLTSQGDHDVLSFAISGPPFGTCETESDSELGVLRLTIQANSAYTIPVEIADIIVNDFALGTAPAGAQHGLLVVRDSCRNRLVRLDGFSVLAPYPNPVISAATFPLLLYEEGAVSVRVFDALGRCLRESAAFLYTPGRHRFVLDIGTLENGNYLVEFTMGQKRIVRRMMVFRRTHSHR